MKGKKEFSQKFVREFLLLKSFVTTLVVFSSVRNSSRVAVRRPKQGHDKKRSEGVARDIEVLRIQILFAHCPMPLPIEFVVLVCFFCYYYPWHL